MSSRDNNSLDPRRPTGRDPPLDQRRTSHVRPSREDDRNPAAYNAPRPPQGYQVAPPQPPYNPVHPQYPPPHSLVPVQAFPQQRAPTYPYSGPAPYGPPFQVQPPPHVPWIPPPPSLSTTGSGNTESRAIGGSYNNNSTRMDYRSDAQIAASVSHSNTVFNINNLHLSPPGHQPPGPLPVTNSAFPSILSGNTTHPMTQLTSRMQDTTISSSERRIESHSRVSKPGDADFDGDPSRNKEKKSKKSKQTVPSHLGDDEYDYQRGYPGEGSSRQADSRAQPPGHRVDPLRSHNIPQPSSQDRHDYFFDSRDPSRMGSGKEDKSSRKKPKGHTSGHTGRDRFDGRSSRRREEDGDDSSSSSGTASPTGNSASGKGGGAHIDPSTTPRPPANTRKSYHAADLADQSKTGPHPWVGPLAGHRTADSVGGPKSGEAPRISSKDSPSTTRPSVDPRTSHSGPYSSGPSNTTSHPWAGGQAISSDASHTRSGHKGQESDRSEKYSSSRQDPQTRETDVDRGYSGDGQSRGRGYREEVAGTSGQPQSWSANPAPPSAFAPRPTQPEYQSASLNRALRTEHPSWSDSPTSTMSIPKVGREEVPPYGPPGTSWVGGDGSSRQGAHGLTNYSNTYASDTTRTAPRPPQNEVPYLYNSQGQSSLGFKGQETHRPSRRDSISNQSISATERESHPWGGQPAGADGWSTHPQQGPIVAPPIQRASKSFPPSHPMSIHGSVVEGDDIDAHSIAVPNTHRKPQSRLTDIHEFQIYDHSRPTLSYGIQPLGNPSLVPFVKSKGNENLGVKKTADSRIPLYMCSNIIDVDAVAFWYPGPTLFPQSGGRRGVQLGDLGYFEDSGEFRPIFNIFFSHDDNTKEGAHPPSQPYQPLPVDFRSAVRQVDIQRQHVYISSNIERFGQEAGPQSSYQFRAYKKSGRSGAIIVLPHGGSSSCIRNSFFQYPEVKRHFRDHALSWYQHALQHIPIPNKSNGSLVLVRATHCARSWGIATFASKQDIKESLYATFMSNPANQYEHRWQTNDNRWKTSTGPSSTELGELGGREPPINQCIGVVISSLRLDEATWKANFGTLSSSSPDRGSSSLRGWMSRSSISLSSIRVQQDTSGRNARGWLASLNFRTRPAVVRNSIDDDDYDLLLLES